MIGSKLNTALGLGAKHALYRRIGDWYHQLKEFPGVLFDANGYLFFKTLADYERNDKLKRTKDLNVKDGIANIMGYRSFSSEQLSLIKQNYPKFLALKPRQSVKKSKTVNTFTFSPSAPNQVLKVVRKQNPTAISEISQIHRQLEETLYEILCERYQPANLACDCPTGNGTYIDLAVRDNKGFIFYEIKSYADIRQSIREAIGQLLEYAYWNCKKLPHKMIILSNVHPEQSAINYFSFIRKQFSIPIFYQHLSLDDKTLSDFF